MKKALLIAIASFGISTASTAQVEMYINGGAADVSGTTIQVSPEGPGEVVSDIHIKNMTGVSKSWVITRLRINEKALWTDYLCWGHETDPFGGTCYPATGMDFTSWTTPNAVNVGNGEAGVLQTHISPDPTDAGTSTYRYYVSTDGVTFEDSIDIEISFSLGLTQVAPFLTIGVAPNPATDYVTVTAQGVEKASIKMVDVLGNVVLKDTFIGSKKINVTDFRNGIYFIMVEAEGVKPVSRKIIVRH